MFDKDEPVTPEPSSPAPQQQPESPTPHRDFERFETIDRINKSLNGDTIENKNSLSNE